MVAAAPLLADDPNAIHGHPPARRQHADWGDARMAVPRQPSGPRLVRRADPLGVAPFEVEGRRLGAVLRRVGFPGAAAHLSAGAAFSSCPSPRTRSPSAAGTPTCSAWAPMTASGRSRRSVGAEISRGLGTDVTERSAAICRRQTGHRRCWNRLARDYSRESRTRRTVHPRSALASDCNHWPERRGHQC